jgi:hypothetical protein
MDSDDSAKTDFERRIQACIDQRRAGYAETHQQIFGRPPEGVGPPPDVSGLSFEDTLAAYEAWAQQRTQAAWAEFFVVRDQQRPAAGLDLAAWVALNGRPRKKLAWVDRFMIHAFDLDHWLPEVGQLPPIHYCTSLEAYVAPLVKHLGLSAAQREDSLRQVAEGAADVPILGEPAYHLPGAGTYINGALLTRRLQASADTLLDGNRAWAARILGQVAAVRWGRGFLDAYTTLGQELGQAGLDTLPLKAALGLAGGEEGRRAQEVQFLSRAGWSEWVGRFVEAAVSRVLQPPWEEQKAMVEGSVVATVAALGELAWKQLGSLVPGAQLIGDVLRFVMQAVTTQATMLALGSLCDDWGRWHYRRETAEPAARQGPRNYAGRALVNSLQRQVGTFNVPYAMLIAGNVRLQHITEVDGGGATSLEVMKASPDGRLIMLTTLPSSPAYDPQRMAIEADDRLRLKAPEAIRHPKRRD